MEVDMILSKCKGVANGTWKSVVVCMVLTILLAETEIDGMCIYLNETCSCFSLWENEIVR